MRKIVYVLLASTAMLLFSGCGTMSLQTNSKLTRSIVLDHSKTRGMPIYVQVTNTANSGGEKMHLEKSIKDGLVKKGYKIVNSSKDASYGLFVNVLFANNLKEANAIMAGAGMGVTSAAIAMGAGSNTGDSLLVGAGAALLGAGVGAALEDETFKAIIDIDIKNYNDNTSRKTRVFSRAVKVDLDLKEALPILEKEATRSIINIF